MKYKLSLLTVLFTSIISLSAYAQTKISVLPFDVLTQKEDMKQFGVGTMDTLTNALNNVPDFIMIDRGQLNSVMKEIAFQGSGLTIDKNTEKIGQLLGAEILVLGTIQSFENKYRITAHFTEVKTGKILKTVQVTGADIFVLQDQLASEIINQQHVKVSPEQQQRISSITKATDNVDAYDYYIKGRTSYLLYTEDGYRKAIDLFEQALTIDKDYTIALAAKAEAQANLANEFRVSGVPYQDLLKQSEVNAKQALTQNKELSDIYRALSNVYNIQENYPESKIQAETAIKLNPNDAEAYTLLWFDNSMLKKKFESNDPLIAKSLERNPRLVLTHSLLSSTYYGEQNLDKAIEESQLTVKFSPDYLYGYITLGNIYLEQNKFEESFKAYSQAKKLSPQNSYARLGIANVYFEQKKFDEAIIELKEAIKSLPDLSPAYYTLAYVYKEKGQYKESSEIITQTIKLFPYSLKYTHVQYLLGFLAEKENKIDEAKMYFKKSLEINPKNTASSNALSAILLNSGINMYQQTKYDDAISSFNEIIKISPKNFDAFMNLGSAYYGKKDLDNASKMYLQAIEIDQKHAGAHYNLALSYTALGKNELAKSEYKKSCELGMKEACGN